MEIGNLYLCGTDLYVVTGVNPTLGINQYNEVVPIPSGATLVADYKQLLTIFGGAICQI